MDFKPDIEKIILKYLTSCEQRWKRGSLNWPNSKWVRVFYYKDMIPDGQYREYQQFIISTVNIMKNKIKLKGVDGL